MSAGRGRRPETPGGTLTFGADDAVPRADAPPAPMTAPRTERDRARAASRRAAARRRAAQRRSRVRMREGSEALLAFLVLLGLTLLLVDVRTGGSAFAGPRTAAAAVVGPLQAGVDRVTDPPILDGGLAAENERLRAELLAAAGDRARLRELERLFAVTGRGEQEVVAASIVAGDPGGASATAATIDRGTDDGVGTDQAVIAAGGLAGAVVSASPGTAVVRFVTDPAFAVGGRLVGSGQAGVVRGTGDPRRLAMELLDPLASVRIGERVVTYGSPGGVPFPPGLVVGTVVGTGDPGGSQRTLAIAPSADPGAAWFVGVVRPPAAERAVP